MNKDYSWLWWVVALLAGILLCKGSEGSQVTVYSTPISLGGGDAGRYESASNTAQAMLTEMEQDNRIQIWELQATQEAGSSSQLNCNIKGNIAYDTGEKIYHLPGQKSYNKTVINPDYGERWFCTEAEAQANGWRKAYQ